VLRRKRRGGTQFGRDEIGARVSFAMSLAAFFARARERPATARTVQPARAASTPRAVPTRPGPTITMAGRFDIRQVSVFAARRAVKQQKVRGER